MGGSYPEAMPGAERSGSPTLVGRLWTVLRKARPSKPTESYAAGMQTSRLLVLIATAQACQDRPGQLGVTIAQVAEYAGLSPSTVGQHLSALHRTGWVQRRGAGRPVLYAIGRITSA
jgi:DNA-binding transcriptional ArsR family regulator